MIRRHETRTRLYYFVLLMAGICTALGAARLHARCREAALTSAHADDAPFPGSAVEGSKRPAGRRPAGQR